jgi:hypothetical protein
MAGILAPYSLILIGLRKTPLPKGVALVLERDDPRPRISSGETHWFGTIYLVRKNGLPLYMPPSAKRATRLRFLAGFVADVDPLVNMIHIEEAARGLVLYAAEKLANHRAGMKAAKTMRDRKSARRGPGRPRGILRSMEKTGSNRPRNCLRCGGKHGSSPCRPVNDRPAGAASLRDGAWKAPLVTVPTTRREP